MASIINDPNGTRRIQFVGPDRSRRTIRLGKISRRQAESVKTRIETLISHRITGVPLDGDTSAWLTKISDELRNRLANVGLTDGQQVVTLQDAINAFKDKRSSSVTPQTVVNWDQAFGNLLAYFGDDRRLVDITEQDADLWRAYLVQRGLALATTNKRVQNAKMLFRDAVRNRWIATSPFADLKSPTIATTQKEFVGQETIAKVIEQAPDAQWRLLIALARYGGMRIPSEAMALRWKDINWDLRRVTVTSPKTAHHKGKDHRIIPLFPELHPYLLDAFEQAGEGEEHVITICDRKCTPTWLRKSMLELIRRAGLEPWPKIFQNLRASRETELTAQFPLHVVCRWIGNNQVIANNHYLMVQDHHFDEASGLASDKAVQNAAQHMHETTRNDAKPENAEELTLHHKSGDCDSFREDAVAAGNVQMGPAGFEPATNEL